MVNMRTVQINAPSWSSEDLYIETSLSDEQLIKTLRQIIDIERDEGEWYSNDILVDWLQYHYPIEYVKAISKIDKLIF
jgi:hypothetical protein